MYRSALVAALAGAAVSSASALASAPPVGPLPAGPTTTITAAKGTLVSVALPQRSGKSWRLARRVSSRVLVETGEADVGSSVVVVYRAVGRGTVRVAYGLTRGETAHAYASATFIVRIR
ncbi:MAG TPA: hypothetical protein VFA24_00725 [Gaiellaceae bacterium]|nr:hypothetical protein [Gaiellaceae bacterium]